MDMTTALRNYNRLINQRATRRTTTKARYWLHVHNTLLNARYAAMGFPVCVTKDAKPRTNSPTYKDARYN